MNRKAILLQDIDPEMIPKRADLGRNLFSGNVL